MVTNQAYLFLIFMVNGIIIGILFDFFRILRKSFKTADLITYIEDILFWILTGIILLYSIFVFSNGEIRLFMFLAVILGTIIYMLIASKYVIKINVTIITFVKKILLVPINFIAKILRKIFFKPISFVIINIKKISTNLCKNTYNNLKNIKFKKNSVKN